MAETLSSAWLASKGHLNIQQAWKRIDYSPGKSGISSCFSFSFLLPDLPNKPATKLFLRLATFTFSGSLFSPTGVVSSRLVGGVSSPARGDALMLERDYHLQSAADIPELVAGLCPP